jgi:hypothetical protein
MDQNNTLGIIQHINHEASLHKRTSHQYITHLRIAQTEVEQIRGAPGKNTAQTEVGQIRRSHILFFV